MNARRCTLLAFVAALALAAAAPGSASAASPGPGWLVSSVAQPTNFSTADNALCARASLSFCDHYIVTLTNIGGSPTNSPVVITDDLPPDLMPVAMSGKSLETSIEVGCDLTNTTCTYSEPVSPGDTLEVDLEVEVQAGTAPGQITNAVTVSGGGALDASGEALTTPNTVDGPPASFGISAFGFDAHDVSGQLDAQAGGHPYGVTSTVDFNTAIQASPNGLLVPASVEYPKSLVAYLPFGFIGDPTAAARCTELQLLSNGNKRTHCPPASRVGTLVLLAENIVTGTVVPQEANGATSAVYNMIPEHGYPAQLAFTYAGVPVQLYTSVVRTPAGYELRASFQGLPTTLHVEGAALTLFGDPHSANGEPEPHAFFTNPSNCTAAPLTARLQADSWPAPGEWIPGESVAYPKVTGCDQLSFKPTFTLAPDTTVADSPTGPTVDLKVPQAEPNPETLATPPLKDATVTLPPGLSVNPSSAGGLAGCPAEGPNGINVGSDEVSPEGQDLGDPEATEVGTGKPGDNGLYHTAPGHCPLASQIGEVEVTTPLLPDPLHGRVYLGAPECGPCTNQDAKEGRLLKLYIEAEGSGVIVKLPGTVSADPATGQLSATFKNNPQLPFSDLKLNFKTGARAPLRTPATCGSFTTNADLTPWSHDPGPKEAEGTPIAHPSSSFDVNSGPNGTPCANTPVQQPNHPAFSAGTTIPKAGAYSPFVLHLSREDGSQELKGIDTTLPPGLSGKLAGVPYCSEAQLAAAEHNGGKAEQATPSCPLASQVGTVNVGAGAGESPFYVGGHAYLAGPYKGAPLSLAIITPALAGPFDLGTVVVRTALYVNPETAQIHAVSDPIPTILDGIPLDVRSIALNMDRGQFTLNPTSCDPMAITGSALSVLNQSASLSNPFQVGGCSGLGFKPKLAIKLKGGTHRNDNPALTATLKARPGDANIARAQVTLPHSAFLDQSHIGTVCTRVQFAAHACPPASVYGKAIAYTPLLDQPLSGPVYLRSSSNKLPDLVADLNGQIEVTLDGKVDTGKGGGIRNTFSVVPDAPVSKFVLSMQGGSKGLLVNSENICSHTQKALAHFVAQNGRVDNFNPVIANSCAAKHKHRGGKR